MRWMLVALAVLLPLSLCYAKDGSSPNISTREKAIQKYFANRTLQPIEGIWTDSTGGGETAIFKNNTGEHVDWEFIGVVISRVKKNRVKIEDLMLLINSTASDKVYTAAFLKRGKPQMTVNMIMVNFNFITIREPADSPGTLSLLRVYPKTAPQGNQITPTPSPVISTPGDYSNIFNLVAPSIVVVVGKDAKGVMTQGSGVVLAPRLVITNYHVLQGAQNIAVGQGSAATPAIISTYDAKRDLCMLFLDQPIGQMLSTRAALLNELQIGQKLLTIGYPRGLSFTFADGILSGVRSLNGVTLIQTTAPISPGSSGGALFNLSGQLVGITTAFLVDSQNLNFAVSSNDVLAFLAQARDAAEAAAAQPRSDLQPVRNPTRPPRQPTERLEVVPPPPEMKRTK